VQTTGGLETIVDLVFHPTDPRILFAADFNAGVYRSSDGGKTWTLVSKVFRIRDGGLEIDSQDGKYLYYKADSMPGAFVSSDGGDTWQKINKGLGGWLTIHPDNGAVVYAQPGDSPGSVIVSRDAGQTWHPLGKLNAGQIGAISFLPRAHNTLLVGGQGLYITNNEGETWIERSGGLGGPELELVLDPSTPTTLFIQEGLCWTGESRSLFRSTDGGKSWSLASSTKGCGLVFDANQQAMYWSVRASDSGGHLLPLRSINGGATWEKIPFPNADADYVLAAHPRRPGMLYAFGSRFPEQPASMISTDGGAKWEDTTGLDAVQLEVELFFDQAQGQIVYLVSGYSVFRSDNTGRTWIPCGKTNVWSGEMNSRAAIDPRNSSYLIVATRGSGVLRSSDGCKTWQIRNSGLGNLIVNTVAIDPKSPDRVYAGTDGGAYVSFDGGNSWSPINDGLLGALVVYSIVIDPRNSNVYATTPYGVFRLEAR
jgi:photosystem II stability/assembly factor-like uncharacterized protein